MEDSDNWQNSVFSRGLTMDDSNLTTAFDVYVTVKGLPCQTVTGTYGLSSNSEGLKTENFLFCF